MHKGEEIPQESIELAVAAYHDRLLDPKFDNRVEAMVRDLFEAAAPSLRTTYRAELEEELLGEEALRAAAKEIAPGWDGSEDSPLRARAAIKAALSIAGERDRG